MIPARINFGAVLLIGLVSFSTRTAAQSNGILREVYSNIDGSAVSDLTNNPAFPSSPTSEYIESFFEAPVNFADSYGQRMRALLVPPVSGSYVFWISSDDNSVLYLSTDENPSHKVLIATVNGWTSSREWTKETNQRSAPIMLSNGQRYYVEALQKEGTGGDSLAVRWQLPSGTIEEPIPATRMLPYGLGPPVITAQPQNTNVVEGNSATFTIQLGRALGATYQWLRNGTNIPNATNASYFLAPVALTDSGSTFGCFVINPYGSTNSSTATLNVTADLTRPAITSIGSLGDPGILTVIFSELVEMATASQATNYGIASGVTVVSAAFGTDRRTIILTTTPMAPRTTYILTVNNVRDLASTPNPILPNTQRTFRIDSTPLDISYLRLPAESMGPSTRHSPISISEIMYHPTNRVDGKNLEFIELYNSQPYAEDISGFRISGSVDYTFPSNTLMNGLSYLAVAAAPADLRSVYGLGTVLGPYTNDLPNSSGTIRFRNSQDAILVEVNYSGGPPYPAAADGAGHSLVLARPSYGPNDARAWMASDLAGGSPGAAEPAGINPFRTVVINEFLAHTDDPELDFIELYNYSASSVNLSGCVLTDDATTNKFIIPPATIIPAQGFLAYDQAQLNFSLDAAGETIYFKNTNGTRVLDAVRFEAQEKGVSTGRFPDGAPNFYPLLTKTPGTNNTAPRVPEIVINEIMYDPISGDSNDEYIELYNRGTNDVNVGKWNFTHGLAFTIPANTVIPAGGYLVVAKSAARLLINYPNLNTGNTVGDFSGNLAGGGERMALAKPDEIISTNALGQAVTNTTHIVVDEVTYGSGGRWGVWSHGGGSSLELIDAHSDGRLAPNWADSDETSKSAWTTIEFTGVLDNGNGAADSLQIMLLGAGECLVDNVEVIPTGGGNLIANSTFEGGLTGWVPQGNHNDSNLENTGFNSSRCLHIRATGHGDTGANRIRTPLTAALSAGQTATLRAKVKWLRGHPEILLRLKGNWLEATGNILTARNLGTPGAPNSMAVINAGPAMVDVKHTPALPAASQAVTVSARVYDPDGLTTLVLKYRVDPSTNFNLVSMANNGAGLFSATIPGQPLGTIVAFHLQASDNFSPSAFTIFPNDTPSRECLVRWGDPAQSGSFGTYRFWITQATLNLWSNREKLSNKPLDGTFVYGNQRVIYNVGGEYAGSPYHSPGYNSPIGNVCDYVLVFPEDDPLLGETEINLQWPGNGGGDNTYQREQTAYWIGNQLGLPLCYRRHVNLFINGVRRAQMFEDVQQPNGDMVDEWYPEGKDGDLHKVQLWFEFDDAASGFTVAGANLGNYITSGGVKKLARYRWTWAKRAFNGSANNYTNLFALVDAVNTTATGEAYTRVAESAMDVENWLRTYAVEHIVGNNDSYAYGGGQNMYGYKPPGDTWKLMIWDIDFAFASAGPTTDLFNVGGGGIGPNLNHPPFLRAYWRALQEAANGPLLSTKVGPVVYAKYNAMIASGATVDNPSSITNFCGQRRDYILQLLNNVASSFTITSNGGNDFATNRNLILLTGSAPVGVKTIKVNGIAYNVTWTSVTNWLLRFAVNPGTNALAVQGFDSHGALVVGASDTISVNYTGLEERDKLVINEIMYNPAIANASFVEIYNSSTLSAFDLSNWRLSGVDYTFPGGTLIEPQKFIVLAKDRKAFTTAYGISIAVLGEFDGSLRNSGETLKLIKPGATPAQDSVVDQVAYESRAPWPSAANGLGPSLQLIDPAQDNARVGNWGTASFDRIVGWRYATASGTVSSSRLYVFLGTPGDAYVDDIVLVAGNTPEAGPNLIRDGGFESTLSLNWTNPVSNGASTISTAIKHSGSSSLHLISTNASAGPSTAIYQDIVPALSNGATYTLSYWYLPGANNGPLVARILNNLLSSISFGSSNVALATPGTNNSIRAFLPPFPNLWLNELLPNNLNGSMDQFGHRHPWVELYNGGSNAISLGGYFLANNYTNLAQWPFPTNASIDAGQFLVVWLDGNPAESINGELHTGFTIPPDAGALALGRATTNQPTLLDYLNFYVPSADRSYGDFPDGDVSGRRAFAFVTAGATNDPALAPVDVFINEWMAANSGALADPADGDFDDWFEVYNPGSNAVSLAGYFLTDNLTNQFQFEIPSGYSIPAGGYLLVWADNEPGQNSTNRLDLHVNFQLSKDKEAIGLFAPDGTLVDGITFEAQTNDVSQGRWPDGSASFYFMTTPTPRTANLVVLPNTPPVLDNIADKFVSEGQWLIFNITATDTNEPPQTLTFSLDSGAPAGATLNSETGLFAWRPMTDQTPSTNILTVRVVDNGTPNLGDSKAFKIVAVPLPRISSVGFLDNILSLRWQTHPGRTYRVQYSDDLNSGTWTDLGPDITATGFSTVVVDPLGSAPQRFYRVWQVD